MADNLKPYDPNKGFISFRLNPDAIKEALIEQVPYNRTLRHIYNNPEGDIRETAELAASETPVLGSLLAGEPTNAIEEALLLGAPVKASRNALNKHKNNREWYNYDQRLYYKNNKGELVDVERGFPKGEIEEARKYNDYQAALDDLNLTETARNVADDIGERNLSNKRTEGAINLADDYLKKHKVASNKELYWEYPNTIIVYDPVKGSGINHSRYGGNIWSNSTSITPKSTLESRLKSGDAIKIDNQTKLDLNKSKKDVLKDIRLFNNDPRWFENPEFHDMSLKNPGHWRWEYTDE